MSVDADSTSVEAGVATGTWAVDGSPYHVSGSLYIPRGDSLVIRSGVEIIFNEPGEILVDGVLRAFGTSDAPILIHSGLSEDWGPIHLRGDAVTSLEYVHMTGVYASWDGGGGMLVEGQARATLAQCKSVFSARPIRVDDNGAILARNSLFADSRTLFEVAGGALVLLNSTVTNVSSSRLIEVPLYAQPETRIRVINSLLWNFSDTPFAPEYSVSPVDIQVRFTFYSGNTRIPGVGNFNIDPQFAGAVGGEYTLALSSPAINTGNPAILDADGSASDRGWTGGDGVTTYLPVATAPRDLLLIGTTEPAIVPVANLGFAPLAITGVTLPNGVTTSSSFPLTARSGETVGISISYNSTSTSPDTVSMSVQHNDTLTADLVVGLKRFAGTVAGGEESGTWIAANSPYRVKGAVHVPLDSTLTIEPGVDVLFDGDAPLVVYGSLHAVGTQTDSIRFLPADDSDANEWLGISLLDADSSTLEYVRISGAKADKLTEEFEGRVNQGGALSVVNTNIRAAHCVFSNNQALTYPAGVLAPNQIRLDGGGVAITVDLMSDPASPSQVYAVFEDCRFENNYSYGRGGGLYVGVGATVDMTSCTFDGNLARNAGGGIYTGLGATLRLTDCAILRNKSIYTGSAIYFGGDANLSLTDCLVEGNIRDGITSGPYPEDSYIPIRPYIDDFPPIDEFYELRMDKSRDIACREVYTDPIPTRRATLTRTTVRGQIIEGREAYRKDTGGGIDVSATELIIDDCDIRENAGPGIIVRPAVEECPDMGSQIDHGLHMTNSRVEENGGGIMVENSRVNVTGSTIRGNKPSGDAKYAGIYLSTSYDCRFERCLISDNSVVYDEDIVTQGTAISARGRASVSSYEYPTPWGMKWMLFTPRFEFINCTIAGNGNPDWGGAVTMTDFGDLHLMNSVVWNNTPIAIMDSVTGLFDHVKGAITVEYSNLESDDGPWFAQGVGNFSDDPLFIDAAAGDYSIAAGSPCIDTGNPYLIDIDGSPADIGYEGGDGSSRLIPRIVTSLDTVAITNLRTKALSVTNTGWIELVLSGISLPDSFTTDATFPTVVPPGDTVAIAIGYEGIVGDTKTATLSHSDNVRGDVNVTLIGAMQHVLLGQLSGTLRQEIGVYRVAGPVIIPSDETLIIEPGVDVIFDADVPFIVYGKLDAFGTVDDSIRFLPGIVPSWGGLRFWSDRNETNVVLNETDSSTIAYMRLNGAVNDVFDDGIYFGGGIDVRHRRLGISNSVISHCRGENGGGIRVESGSVGVAECRVDSNKALSTFGPRLEPGSGGGVYLTDSRFFARDCSFSYNIVGEITRFTAQGGGGIMVNQSTAYLDGCLISTNTVVGNGGGVDIVGSSAVSMYDCYIDQNVAAVNGGAISIDGDGIPEEGMFTTTQNEPFEGPFATLDVHTAYLYNNTALDGGGIYDTDSAEVSLDNVTYAGNVPNDRTTITDAAEEAQPHRFTLQQNAPNPFNPETIIRFSMPAQGDVSLTLYNITGQRVRTLLSRSMPLGSHEAVWNGRDDVGRPVASGVYLYRLDWTPSDKATDRESRSLIRRMTLVR
jgi:predicted outer membrane repeat protein